MQSPFAKCLLRIFTYTMYVHTCVPIYSMWKLAFQIRAVSDNLYYWNYSCIQRISISKLVLTEIIQRINTLVKTQKHLNRHSRKQQVKYYYIGIIHCPSGPTGTCRRQVQVAYWPSLLHPLLLWYSEWIAALVVDISNHLLPAVIWCLRNYQLIALWNQYENDPETSLGIHGIWIQRHFLFLLFLV